MVQALLLPGLKGATARGNEQRAPTNAVVESGLPGPIQLAKEASSGKVARWLRIPRIVAANFVRQSVICCAAVFELLLDWALAVWAWIEKTCRSKDPVDHCRGQLPLRGRTCRLSPRDPGRIAAQCCARRRHLAAP